MYIALIVMLLITLSTVKSFTPTSMKFARRSLSALNMHKGVGDSIPNDITFKCRVRDESLPGPNPFTWKDVTTGDLFKGKRAVVFALPGGENTFHILRISNDSIDNIAFCLYH
jgi:hypothetical protein